LFESAPHRKRKAVTHVILCVISARWRGDGGNKVGTVANYGIDSDGACQPLRAIIVRRTEAPTDVRIMYLSTV
jgi:hypothetical protein